MSGDFCFWLLAEGISLFANCLDLRYLCSTDVQCSLPLMNLRTRLSVGWKLWKSHSTYSKPLGKVTHSTEARMMPCGNVWNLQVKLHALTSVSLLKRNSTCHRLNCTKQLHCRVPSVVMIEFLWALQACFGISLHFFQPNPRTTGALIWRSVLSWCFYPLIFFFLKITEGKIAKQMKTCMVCWPFFWGKLGIPSTFEESIHLV